MKPIYIHGREYTIEEWVRLTTKRDDETTYEHVKRVANGLSVGCCTPSVTPAKP